MSHPKFGFPPAFKAAGYDVIDAGLFRMDTDDFSTQIAAFKDAGVVIIAGHAFENHLATFWNQAIQVGFTPKICTIAAGLLFPSSVDNLGDRGNGMSTEVWWTPTFPYTSPWPSLPPTRPATSPARCWLSMAAPPPTFPALPGCVK